MRRGGLRRVVVLAAALCVAAACSAGTATQQRSGSTAVPSPPLVWRATRIVLPGGSDSPDAKVSWSVNCPTDGSCLAVGVASQQTENTNYTAPVIYELEHGSWRKHPIASIVGGATHVVLGGSSCTPSDFCVTLAGRDNSGDGPPLLLTRNHGTWSTQAVSGPVGSDQSLALEAVSCARTQCFVLATGESTTGPASSFALTVTPSGIQLTPLPRPQSTGDRIITGEKIACAQDATCVVPGQGFDGEAGPGWVYFRDGGRWTRVDDPVPTGGSSEAYSSDQAGAACTAGTCAVVGSYTTGGGASAGWLNSVHAGVWSPVVAPGSGDSVQPAAVACDPSGDCTAVGPNRNGTFWQLHQGGWRVLRGATTAGLTSVSCPASASCVAVGATTSDPTVAAVASGTALRAVRTPLPTDADRSGPSQLVAVQCASARLCVAGGSYTSRQHMRLLLETYS